MTLITVYDNDNILDTNRGGMPRKLTVNAVCVGGDDGVRAYFPHPDKVNLMCEAGGDDGHWWMIGTIGNDWVEEIINGLKLYNKDPIVVKRKSIKTARINILDDGISLDIYQNNVCIDQCGCIKYNANNTPKDLKTLLQNMHCKTMYIVLADGNNRASNDVILTTKVNAYKNRVKRDG